MKLRRNKGCCIKLQKTDGRDSHPDKADASAASWENGSAHRCRREKTRKRQMNKGKYLLFHLENGIILDYGNKESEWKQ